MGECIVFNSYHCCCRRLIAGAVILIHWRLCSSSVLTWDNLTSYPLSAVSFPRVRSVNSPQLWIIHLFLFTICLFVEFFILLNSTLPLRRFFVSCLSAFNSTPCFLRSSLVIIPTIKGIASHIPKSYSNPNWDVINWRIHSWWWIIRKKYCEFITISNHPIKG